MPASKRTLLQRLQSKYGSSTYSYNKSNIKSTNSTPTLTEPSRKRQKLSNIAIQSNKNVKQTNTNDTKVEKKVSKTSSPIECDFDSLTIGQYILSGYMNQKIRILFGSKLIAIQWKMIQEKDRENCKLYRKTVTKRINVAFDSIQSITHSYNKLNLKLKTPPFFTEQPCENEMNSRQKSNRFYIIQNDPTHGNAQKYKAYEIKLSKNRNFVTKIQQKSAILNQLFQQNYDNNSDDIFDAEALTKNEKKIKTKMNKIKAKYLSDNEVNKILISLGVTKKECKSVNHCLRMAIRKKYIGITNGKYKLDINGGLNQKMTGFCASMPDCMEITLQRLVEQPLMGDDYESGHTRGAAVCVCEDCDGDICGGTQYVTSLCEGKPYLDNGKGHNHCEKCEKCMGDYRNRHCYKCGIHNAYWGECDNCDKS